MIRLVLLWLRAHVEHVVNNALLCHWLYLIVKQARFAITEIDNVCNAVLVCLGVVSIVRHFQKNVCNLKGVQR